MQNNENKGEERSDYREVRRRQALSEKEERTERALFLFSFFFFLFFPVNTKQGPRPH